MADELFEQCKNWHRQHAASEGWILIRCEECVCEFIKDSFPLGVDLVKIKRVDVANNRQSFSFTHVKRDYRGSMPRVLDKKEYVCDQRDGFDTLQDLLTHLAST